jgi:MFS family permease
MLSTYRRILDPHAHPGAWMFSLTGLFARLPISMAGLGIVLMVEAARGSYGAAGLVSAAYLVANAATAVVQGRLLDTLGQRRVLVVAAAAFAVAVSLLVASVQEGWSTAVTYGAAALAGATLPQITTCVRTRWRHVLDEPADLQTAFALEAVIDEAVFIIGPIVVATLATLVHPAAGLLTGAAAGAVGALVFAAQRGTEPPAQPHDHSTGARPRLPWATLVPLTACAVAFGTLFGAAEVTTVAFAEEQGHRAWSGGLLALWALGSLLSGVVTGTVAWRIDLATRLRRGAAAMALAMLPLALVDSIWLMGALLLLGGAAIAPTMVATISLTEQRMPPSRLTETLAIVETGLVVGVAPGAALSGLVVDHHGASAAYLVSLGAGVLAAVAAWLVPRTSPTKSLEPLEAAR